MQRSPCAACKWGMESKSARRCTCCERRIAYVDSLEPAVECRNDPSYQGSYTLPGMFSRQLGFSHCSSWDLIPF